jgi:hypothetical protein
MGSTGAGTGTSAGKRSSCCETTKDKTKTDTK